MLQNITNCSLNIRKVCDRLQLVVGLGEVSPFFEFDVQISIPRKILLLFFYIVHPHSDTNFREVNLHTKLNCTMWQNKKTKQHKAFL